MSRESVLARGRVQAEARMTDTCKVGLKVRSEVLNEATGLYEETIEPAYEGVCEIQFGNTQPNVSDSGAQLITSQDAVLKLPVSEVTGGITDGMFAEITGSGLDEGLVGLVFKITGFNAKTYSTCRRFPVRIDS